MNFKRGEIARLAMTSAVAIALAGLAGSATAETVTLKVWSLKTVGQTGWEDFFNNAIAEYKTTHPDVDVVYEQFPNEAYKTTIQVALVGSDPPDVFFNWSGEDAARLARDGLALDITDLGKGPTGFTNVLSPGWLSAFQYNGRYYGAATDAVSKYFYYNKPFFAEHNLQPPADFDGLLGLCKAIRAIDPNIVPMPIGNSERWKLNHYITMLNERVMGAEATAADYSLSNAEDKLFTDPGYVQAWQKVLDLQNAGCWQDAPNATSPESIALHVLLGAVADDLLRLLVRGDFRRRWLHRLRHVPHAAGDRRKGRREREFPRARRFHDLGEDQASAGGR